MLIVWNTTRIQSKLILVGSVSMPSKGSFWKLYALRLNLRYYSQDWISVFPKQHFGSLYNVPDWWGVQFSSNAVAEIL